MDQGPGLEKDGPDDKITYSITEVMIETGIFPLELVDCTKDTLNNRWELYDIHYLDIWSKWVYSTEKRYMYQSINTVMANLEILRTYHETGINKMLNTGLEIKQTIKSIDL